MSKLNHNCEFQVEGMHCAGCELTVERALGKLPGVQKVDAILSTNKVKLSIAEGVDVKMLKEEMNVALSDTNYRIVDQVSAPEVDWDRLRVAFVIAGLFVIVFLLLQRLGIANWITAEQVDLPVVFLLGIVASLSTCMAVVGGLVLTISANYAKENQNRTLPLLTFHAARLVAFFIFGGVIGLLGSAFTLSPITIFIMNVILFAVMLIMGLNMLEIFPALHKFQLHMPKFLSKGVVRGDVSGYLAPVFMGAVTFFLPCGFTQSMQVYSLTTGSFLQGALTMFVFALGTLPVLALISFTSTKLSQGLNSKLFFKTAGFLIVFFAVFNFIAALAAIGLIDPVLNL